MYILPYLVPGTFNTASRNPIAHIKAAHSVSKHHQIRATRIRDYFQQSTYLLTKSDGGPPRWFSPLECGSRLDNSPLLLTLPGIDGNGHALLMHYKRLGQIFDIWCLHIPLTDRTSFTDLVMLVERAIRSESRRIPNRPIYIVGESVGSCLALVVAARNQNINLVLVLANPGVPSRMIMATADVGLPFQETVTNISEDVSAWFSYIYGLTDVSTAEIFIWKLKMVKFAYEFSNEHIGSVSAKTLILFSGRDQVLPSPVEGKKLCQILPKCQMRMFNDCSHALFLEEDVDLATIIEDAGFYNRAVVASPCPLKRRKSVDLFKWTDVAVSPVLLSTFGNEKIVRGLDGIPTKGPVLFVGNHNMLGMDVIAMVRHLIIERNIDVRPLAHPMLFKKFKHVKFPTYDFLRDVGVVPVSASNMYQLFSMKSHVLLYPGGVREALHRRGEEYKLFWPKQAEFVRMAAKFGAKIVPFGAVGEDDFTQLVFDYDDQMKNPLLKACIEELTNQFVKLRTEGEGEFANQDIHVPGFLPKFPGRYYYLFGKPIETQGMEHELRNKEKAEEVYSQVKCEVEKCIAYLLRRREEDPYRINIMARFMYQATHGGLDSQVPTFHID